MRPLNARERIQTLAATALLAVVPVLPVAGHRLVLLGQAARRCRISHFALVVLLFSLGPRNLTEDVEDYTRALGAAGRNCCAPQRAKALTEREAPTRSH